MQMLLIVLENSILGTAIQAGDMEIIKEVIKTGVKLDQISGGRTPLIFAACLQRWIWLNLLLKAGANVDARDI